MTVSLSADIEIRRVLTPEEAAHWRVGFVGAYQTIFAGPPYHERFTPDEAEGIWRSLTSTPGHISLLATRGRAEVVGFGIAIPLAAKKDVARALSGLVPAQHTMYLAELGVLHEYRGQKLGRTLLRERMRLIDPARYSHVVLRVSAGKNASYEMYRSMDFEDMGVYMEVVSRRTDGRVATDRRLFLHRVLSQVDMED